MSDVTSYLWLYGDERHRERVQRFGEFTVVFENGEIRTGAQVALLSWDGDHIEALAVGIRTVKVASFEWTARFSHAVECDPIPLDSLVKHLDRHAARAVARGGQLNSRTTKAIRQALEVHYPDAAALWAETERLGVSAPPELWPQDREPVFAYERDAVGLAVDAAGLDRRQVLASWDGNDDEPFLTGLSDFRIYEDPAIVNDTQVFGDWERIGTSPLGLVRFERAGKRLTIINANRLPIEEAVGCDLVYYTKDYDAYVLVQYKRLRKEKTNWVYRPDKKFDSELARMREIAAPGEDDSSPEQHRLGQNFCFVKLCRPATSNPFSGELAPGFYLPLDYLDKLVKAGRLKGPKDGTIIDRVSVGRHLVNGSMVSLVSDAWVGTRGLATQQVEEVIRRSLDAGHSVVAAAAASVQVKPA